MVIAHESGKMSSSLTIRWIFLLFSIGCSQSMRLKCKLLPLSYKQPICIINCGDIPAGRNLEYLIDDNSTYVSLRNCFVNSFSRIPFHNPKLSKLELIDYKDHKNLTASDIYCGDNLRILILEGFFVSVLQSLSFISCPKLVELFITNASLMKILKNAFFGLKYLEKLDMTDNNISVLNNDAFKELVSLSHLRLTGNHLKTLSKDLFINADGILLKIDFDTNQIATVGNIFPNTSVIVDFSMNNLKSFYVNEYFTNVSISYNLIKELNCSTNPLKITQLLAPHNLLHRIICIDKMTKLVELNLAWNNFDHVNVEWFKNMKNIKILDFSCNPMIKLDMAAIKQMNKRFKFTSFGVRIKTENFPWNEVFSNQTMKTSKLLLC